MNKLNQRDAWMDMYVDALAKSVAVGMGDTAISMNAEVAANMAVCDFLASWEVTSKQVLVRMPEMQEEVEFWWRVYRAYCQNLPTASCVFFPEAHPGAAKSFADIALENYRARWIRDPS